LFDEGVQVSNLMRSSAEQSVLGQNEHSETIGMSDKLGSGRVMRCPNGVGTHLAKQLKLGLEESVWYGDTDDRSVGMNVCYEDLVPFTIDEDPILDEFELANTERIVLNKDGLPIWLQAHSGNIEVCVTDVP